SFSQSMNTPESISILQQSLEIQTARMFAAGHLTGKQTRNGFLKPLRQMSIGSKTSGARNIWITRWCKATQTALKCTFGRTTAKEINFGSMKHSRAPGSDCGTTGPE